MATKLSLYNDALMLLGERRLDTDTEAIETRYDLDALYDNGAVDYCLEVVKPRYAVKVDQITGVAATAETTFTYQVTLPANFIALDGVFLDGLMESPVERYVREGNDLLTDVQAPYVRYIQDFATVGLTNMPPSFGRVVSAYLAAELAWKYDPDSEEVLQAKFGQRVETAGSVDMENEPQARAFTPEILTDEWRYIYNDALNILKIDPIATNTDDSLRRNRLDIARQNGLVESVLEDQGWHFGMESKQIFYDPSIDPAWGYSFACEVPLDVHRINGVWYDEFMRNPLRDYVDEKIGSKRYILSSYNVIYMQYVSNDFITDPSLWPAYFKRLVAARLAVDANIAEGDVQAAIIQYQSRRSEAKSTDAINSPPTTLAVGSWSRTRRGPRGHNRHRP